jgi:hypothetical protein
MPLDSLIALVVLASVDWTVPWYTPLRPICDALTIVLDMVFVLTTEATKENVSVMPVLLESIAPFNAPTFAQAMVCALAMEFVSATLDLQGSSVTSLFVSITAMDTALALLTSNVNVLLVGVVHIVTFLQAVQDTGNTKKTRIA